MRLKRLPWSFYISASLLGVASSAVLAQWPTTCVGTNDAFEAQLVQIYTIEDCLNGRVPGLENHGFRTPDETILKREAWWKRALLSREFGLNRN